MTTVRLFNVGDRIRYANGLNGGREGVVTKINPPESGKKRYELLDDDGRVFWMNEEFAEDAREIEEGDTVMLRADEFNPEERGEVLAVDSGWIMVALFDEYRGVDDPDGLRECDPSDVVLIKKGL